MRGMQNLCGLEVGPALEMLQVASGWKHCAAVTGAGKLITWGWGGSMGHPSLDNLQSSGGQLGLGGDTDRWEPAAVEWIEDSTADMLTQVTADGHEQWRALQVACGFNHTAAIFEVSEYAEKPIA